MIRRSNFHLSRGECPNSSCFAIPAEAFFTPFPLPKQIPFHDMGLNPCQQAPFIQTIRLIKRIRRDVFSFSRSSSKPFRSIKSRSSFCCVQAVLFVLDINCRQCYFFRISLRTYSQHSAYPETTPATYSREVYSHHHRSEGNLFSPFRDGEITSCSLETQSRQGTVP